MRNSIRAAIFGLLAFVLATFVMTATSMGKIDLVECGASGCSQEKGQKTISGKIAFFFAAPVNLLAPAIAGLQEMLRPSTQDLYPHGCSWETKVMASGLYRCAYHTSHSLPPATINPPEPKEILDLREKVAKMKALAIQAGLEAPDFAALSNEVEQADELLVELLEKQELLQKKLDSIADSLDQVAEEIGKISHAPVNFALLGQWAEVEEAYTFSWPPYAYLSEPVGIVKLTAKARQEKEWKHLFKPSNALASHTMTRDPWVFGVRGQLSLKLKYPISPKKFVIVSPPASHDINPKAGVKEVEVWGRSTDGRHIFLASYTRLDSSSGHDVIDVNKFDEEGVYFTSFQLFLIRNHGHPEFSKLYQFEAYGVLGGALV